MKDEQILRRVIDKAVENHWLDLNLGLLSNNYICMLDGKIHILGAYKHIIFNSLFEIIFSHSFCKAFWGEKEHKFMDLDEEGIYYYYTNLREWEYRLSQMVLEENPLQYLEKFL